MGWELGYDNRHERWVGYGVPAFCDHPGCNAEIDRGLGFKCEEEGCGCSKFYCERHRMEVESHTHVRPVWCEHPKWVEHLLTDSSWEKWRRENPAAVLQLRKARAQA